MPSEIDRTIARLLDIVQNIDKARGFVLRHDREGFLRDDLTSYAVVRALEIVPGASKHRPDDIRSRYPEIEWHQVRAAGNVYGHDYKGVDLETVWDTVQLHLGPLREVAAAEIVRMGRADLLSEER